MNHFIAIAATALIAGSAAAQTTQTGVLGPSGDPVYSDLVEASNGLTYKCKPGVKVVDGVRSRECLAEDDDAGTIFGEGTGVSAGIGAAAAGLVLIAAASGGGDGAAATTTTGSATVSDLRMKDNISRVGTTSHGLPLYHFSYKGQSGVWEGVMAQDVLQVMPDAVVTMENGFYGVNYEMLGLKMRAVK